MKDAPSTPLIDVESLRMGMFVHLDMGWMAHPFPLSSFKISSGEQISAIRRLGVAQVRWCPAKSNRSVAAELGEQGADDEDDLEPEVVPEVVAGEAAPARAPLSKRHRAALSHEHMALQLCERQFAEAAQAARQTLDLVLNEPERAREQSEALSHALVNKLAEQPEVCIRVLSEASGDRASAHAVNVSVISLLMGRTLGLPDSEMRDLGVGALLHDVGKIDLPDRVRHLEDHFNQAETAFYQEHVAHGVQHARRMGLTSGATLVIAQHHEHADGSGFPLRINTDRMTIASRIVALVNRYDNLCNPRVPTRALTPHEALSLLFAQGKAKYDSAILGVFIKMMGVYPPGSTVQLTDDRYAMVVSVNAGRPLKPRVMVHDPSIAKEEAVLLNLENEPRLGIRRSLRPSQLPVEALSYLSPRTRIAYYFEPDRDFHELAEV